MWAEEIYWTSDTTVLEFENVAVVEASRACKSLAGCADWTPIRMNVWLLAHAALHSNRPQSRLHDAACREWERAREGREGERGSCSRTGCLSLPWLCLGLQLIAKNCSHVPQMRLLHTTPSRDEPEPEPGPCKELVTLTRHSPLATCHAGHVLIIFRALQEINIQAQVRAWDISSQRLPLHPLPKSTHFFFESFVAVFASLGN